MASCRLPLGNPNLTICLLFIVMFVPRARMICHLSDDKSSYCYARGRMPTRLPETDTAPEAMAATQRG